MDCHKRLAAQLASCSDALGTWLARAAMCKAKDKEDPPDYNARLGYGTDQGRWLVDQVGGKEADVVRRVSRVPSRVFHDSNDMAPAPPMHRPASTEPSGVQQLWSSAQQQLWTHHR